MSFWKHDPPYPTEAFKNLGPIRGSDPMAREISSMSASVSSQRAVMEFIDDTLCARKAFATSFDSSDDHRLVVIMFSLGTQLAYTETRVSIAFRPPGVCSPPMSTRDGLRRSATAVPSARNSGLESTWKLYFDADARTRLIDSAVLTGTVDFST